MKADQYSQTAEQAAGARAVQFRRYGGAVFSDPYAFDLLGPQARRWFTNPLLFALRGWLLGSLRWMAMGQVLVRSRYAEDALERAIGAGVSQYVILSAGLDSFALRKPELMARLRVFEVDHPSTQEFKRVQLAKMGARLPASLEFAPVDFEHEGIADGLGRTSYSVEQRTFFSWLGTVAYLTEDAIFATLRALVDLSPPGSELVFDFGGPLDSVEPNDRRHIERLLRFTARRGEPLLTFEEPDVLLDKMCALGFERVEVLTPAEQEARYLAGHAPLRTLPIAFLARLRRV